LRTFAGVLRNTYRLERWRFGLAGNIGDIRQQHSPPLLGDVEPSARLHPARRGLARSGTNWPHQPERAEPRLANAKASPLKTLRGEPAFPSRRCGCDAPGWLGRATRAISKALTPGSAPAPTARFAPLGLAALTIGRAEPARSHGQPESAAAPGCGGPAPALRTLWP
jgi:hypothetical protein